MYDGVNTTIWVHIRQAFYEGEDNNFTLWDEEVRDACAYGSADKVLSVMMPGKRWAARYFDGKPYDAVLAESQVQGPVFRSIKRISQHLCAPVCNPDHRIGTVAPFNFGSRHLPPELRDFSTVLHGAD